MLGEKPPQFHSDMTTDADNNPVFEGDDIRKIVWQSLDDTSMLGEKQPAVHSSDTAVMDISGGISVSEGENYYFFVKINTLLVW